MERWQNRVALVTGASAGIGAEICKMLANHGIKVVGCARREDKIKEIAKEYPMVTPYQVGTSFILQSTYTAYKILSTYDALFQCDVSDSKAVESMFKWIEQQPGLGKVDICIANAGRGEALSLLNGNL